jgi:hypothetical protein
MEEAYDEAFEYDWTRTGEKTLANDTEQYEKHRFPLAVVGKGDRAIVRWSQGYENYWKAKQDSALAAGDDEGVAKARQHAENARLFDKHLEGITQQFQISFIELDRDLELDKAKRIGRRQWKKESGYHRQARVENAFFRYKSIIGHGLHARSPAGQETEAVLACNILNQMTQRGRPASYAIGR